MCQALHQGDGAKIHKEAIGLQVRSRLSRVLSRVLNTVSFHLIQLLYVLVVEVSGTGPLTLGQRDWLSVTMCCTALYVAFGWQISHFVCPSRSKEGFRNS